MATAVQNLYGIPRHSDGATRINAGVVEGGSAANIVPEEARIVAEVRGETTELMEYVRSNARQVLRSAAEMHGCDVEIEPGAEARARRATTNSSRSSPTWLRGRTA